MAAPAFTQANAFALQDSRESSVKSVSTDLSILLGLGARDLKDCLMLLFATEKSEA